MGKSGLKRSGGSDERKKRAKRGGREGEPKAKDQGRRPGGRDAGRKAKAQGNRPGGRGAERKASGSAQQPRDAGRGAARKASAHRVRGKPALRLDLLPLSRRALRAASVAELRTLLQHSGVRHEDCVEPTPANHHKDHDKR